MRLYQYAPDVSIMRARLRLNKSIAKRKMQPADAVAIMAQQRPHHSSALGKIDRKDCKSGVINLRTIDNLGRKHFDDVRFFYTPVSDIPTPGSPPEFHTRIYTSLACPHHVQNTLM